MCPVMTMLTNNDNKKATVTPLILIVDDELPLARMLAVMVQEMGYAALTAANGEAAMEILAHATRQPALVISDVMMPRMDGLTLARTLHDDPSLKAIPIILMSAVDQPKARVASDHFIIKPFDLDELADLIELHCA